MGRRIILSFPEENVSASAELLGEVAPETCRFIWERLPMEGQTIHGMYSGAEIFLFVDPPASLPPENQVNMPLPGELLYFYQEGGVFVDAPRSYAEVCVVYGRSVQLKGEGGVPTFASLFARLTGDWAEFGELCRRVRYEGPKRLRIRRASGE
jgi:hypothetical protein